MIKPEELIHKIDVGTIKTKCGLLLKDCRYAGAYKYVTCPRCLELKFKYLYETPTGNYKTIDDINMDKLRAFFNKKNPVDELEAFLEPETSKIAYTRISIGYVR